MNSYQLLRNVTAPTLESLGVGGIHAATLVHVTGMQESDYTYIRQLDNGPALSFWQIEPGTHGDLYDNFLFYNPILNKRIHRITGVNPEQKDHAKLLTNLSYACAMSRMVYYRYPFSLPDYDDIDGLWEAYKKYYNTERGSAEKYQFVEAYENSINNIINVYQRRESFNL